MPFQKGVRFLDGPFVLFFFFFFQFQRSKTGAPKAAIVCGFTNQDKIIAVCIIRRIGMNDVIFPHDSQGYQRDQAIFVIAFMIINVTADVGNAQWVPVTGNACHHAIMDPFGFVAGNFSETERIGAGNYFGTHTHNIPDVSANTGGSPFIGYDLRRVIVGFVAHDHTPAMSLTIRRYRHHAGIFLGA